MAGEEKNTGSYEVKAAFRDARSLVMSELQSAGRGYIAESFSTNLEKKAEPKVPAK